MMSDVTAKYLVVLFLFMYFLTNTCKLFEIFICVHYLKSEWNLYLLYHPKLLIDEINAVCVTTFYKVIQFCSLDAEIKGWHYFSQVSVGESRRDEPMGD